MSEEGKFSFRRSENLCDNLSSYYIHFKPLWNQFTPNLKPTTSILSQLSKRKRSANLENCLKPLRAERRP